MSIIPLNRAVIGRDLKEIKQTFGMTTSEACYLFGLSITKWTTIVNKNPDKTLTNPSLALLVRFLSQNPSLSVIPKIPTAVEMYNLISTIMPLNAKEFSVFMGAEGSAFNRWKKNISRQGPPIQRLLYYFKLGLLGRPVTEQAFLLNEWKETVKAEGLARGVDGDVFKVGQWRAKDVIKESKLSMGAKAGAEKSKKNKLRKPSSKKL